MTPERTEKFWSVIRRKQKGLAVILENVDDPHNISAALRSCDAVGVHEVFLLDTAPRSDYQLGRKSSASADKWQTIHRFTDLETCFNAVRVSYDSIYTTHLSEDAQSVYNTDLSASVALMFGNEKDGVSDEALALADGNILIPQHGLVESLNISVACAVTLFEAMRQRNVKGMYETSAFSEAELQAIFKDWEARSEPWRRKV